MNNVLFWNKPVLALALLAAVSAANAQGGIEPPPDKTRGATREPASGVPIVGGPSTTTIAPKKTHKAIAKAKAASAAASR